MKLVVSRAEHCTCAQAPRADADEWDLDVADMLPMTSPSKPKPAAAPPAPAAHFQIAAAARSAAPPVPRPVEQSLVSSLQEPEPAQPAPAQAPAVFTPRTFTPPALPGGSSGAPLQTPRLFASTAQPAAPARQALPTLLSPAASGYVLYLHPPVLSEAPQWSCCAVGMLSILLAQASCRVACAAHYQPAGPALACCLSSRDCSLPGAAKQQRACASALSSALRCSSHQAQHPSASQVTCVVPCRRLHTAHRPPRKRQA